MSNQQPSVIVVHLGVDVFERNTVRAAIVTTLRSRPSPLHSTAFDVEFRASSVVSAEEAFVQAPKIYGVGPERAAELSMLASRAARNALAVEKNLAADQAVGAISQARRAAP